MIVELKGVAYELVNEAKVDRALNGFVTDDGSRKGGVIKEDGTFEPAELIAEYDKMAGLIKRGQDKVKCGSFYNFRLRKAKAIPEVIFTYRINGNTVEVPEGVELPGIVKASRILEEQRIEDAPKRKGKKTK